MGPRLILIYGEAHNKTKGKHQLMIDGKLTCGYREYGRVGGCIVYPTPQTIRLPWEKCMPDGKGMRKFCESHPDAVVWVVKRAPNRDELLRGLDNPTLYYSCCAKNRICRAYKYSLVDTPDRLKGDRTRLLVKGKDPDFWKPVAKKKEFDYLLVGRRADKNEIYFIRQLTEKVKQPRSILWVGGKAHAPKIPKTHHNVRLTPVCGQMQVRDHISRARVGILYTQHPKEGFPQTFLEMTMCGVPAVYSITGPRNPHYFHEENSVICRKIDLISAAELLLQDHNPQECRDVAVANYSISIALDRLIKIAKTGED